jgi:Zn-dependent protease
LEFDWDLGFGHWDFPHYPSLMPNLANPLLLALIVGWIMTVVLHEFAHGLVGYLGGDYTIRERGGLTLNPLQYIHPVYSLLLPAVFLMLGGIPLPGGVTYVRRDLLRNRAWESAVSLAGPAMNFLIFICLSLPFHPVIGWIHPGLDETQWTSTQMFLCGLAQLQMMAVVLNLIPIPPLDGFGAISPYLSNELRTKLTTPPTSTILFIMLFVVIWRVPELMQGIYRLTDHLLMAMGFDDQTIYVMGESFNRCLGVK